MFLKHKHKEKRSLSIENIIKPSCSSFNQINAKNKDLTPFTYGKINPPNYRVTNVEYILDIR
uniref:Uncharacterized protein n=1 Tax=Bartonella schoenbuchensis (strain DSM 13525 / NCTC 13165 / R1) TaxID=687861 RepID=E6YXH8_BARSR|nr:hypothetical protein B11C_10040 [Bartonella schoenbuchensis R1]